MLSSNQIRKERELELFIDPMLRQFVLDHPLERVFRYLAKCRLSLLAVARAHFFGLDGKFLKSFVPALPEEGANGCWCGVPATTDFDCWQVSLAGKTLSSLWVEWQDPIRDQVAHRTKVLRIKQVFGHSDFLCTLLMLACASRIPNGCEASASASASVVSLMSCLDELE